VKEPRALEELRRGDKKGKQETPGGSVADSMFQKSWLVREKRKVGAWSRPTEYKRVADKTKNQTCEKKIKETPEREKHKSEEEEKLSRDGAEETSGKTGRGRNGQSRPKKKKGHSRQRNSESTPGKKRSQRHEKR